MASVNTEALAEAIDYQIKIWQRNTRIVERGLTESRKLTLENAAKRISDGKSLSDYEQEALLRAVDSCLVGIQRQRQQVAVVEEPDFDGEELEYEALGPVNSGQQLELVEALKRSREGLSTWPILSPLAESADVPVPGIASEPALEH